MPGIYVLSAQPWGDQQITKNCGLLPYLFHRRYGWKAVMAGPPPARAYPSLQYVPGLVMETFGEATEAAACAYVEAHAAEMDVLAFHGVFPEFFPVAARYRALRPEGKIYLELDANIHYESGFDWAAPEARAFFASCDVIGASCRAMQCHLGQTWPWVIDYVPNGFFDYTGTFEPLTDADFAAKENIILTVGRIGTVEKNNETLCEAFARAVARGALADWRLELVGPVEEKFLTYLRQFFVRYPRMRRRVLLSGAIFEKTELYRHYRRARVFAMTSLKEGGTPNVVAEALVHGCAMVTSDIDAWEDVVDGGRCGIHFPIGDVAALADALALLTSDGKRLASYGRQAAAYGARAFDFEKIVDELYYLLYERRPGA